MRSHKSLLIAYSSFGNADMLYGDTASGTMLDVILELRNDEVGLGGIEGWA